ncbi:hypothetical protein TW65_05484 [Stemphylium lycopersici]|uniref:LysM domain-containing protein n=1 Tax=Stemphylium lycopersici TaxID=183478 RepID=A0A364MUU2_STELY|nr:hypothetical protein TW65_05484 [Stemphylium lycopersici]RAR04002.1 LysM domain-containing protein [Stemphylium lycopersici]
MSIILSSFLLAGAAMGAPLSILDPGCNNGTISLNGTIPSPLQPGIVPNCDQYYFVKSGEICIDIAGANGISLEQFLEWNPTVGDTCANLLADHYACISVKGHTPTPTNPPNGIETPRPIQPGMVGNCDEFRLVESGETCSVIQEEFDVSLEDLVRWNPAIGDDCTSMWAATNLCVGVMA